MGPIHRRFLLEVTRDTEETPRENRIIASRAKY